MTWHILSLEFRGLIRTPFLPVGKCPPERQRHRHPLLRIRFVARRWPTNLFEDREDRALELG